MSAIRSRRPTARVFSDYTAPSRSLGRTGTDRVRDVVTADLKPNAGPSALPEKIPRRSDREAPTGTAAGFSSRSTGGPAAERKALITRATTWHRGEPRRVGPLEQQTRRRMIARVSRSATVDAGCAQSFHEWRRQRAEFGWTRRGQVSPTRPVSERDVRAAMANYDTLGGGVPVKVNPQRGLRASPGIADLQVRLHQHRSALIRKCPLHSS